MREQSKRSQNKIQPRKVQSANCIRQTQSSWIWTAQTQADKDFEGFYQCHPFRAFLESFKPQRTLSIRPLCRGVWMNSLRQPVWAVGGSRWVHIASILLTFVCPKSVTFAYTKSLNKEKADPANILPCWGPWLQGRGASMARWALSLLLVPWLRQVTVAELRAGCPAQRASSGLEQCQDMSGWEEEGRKGGRKVQAVLPHGAI